MIKNINIKSVATYDHNGSALSDLKKINFIYGANGSGKTTISNLIADPNNPIFNDCSINWEHKQPLDVLVYNKNFRDKNFGKDSIDGIFTLGSATKEDIELIEKKNAELEIIKSEGITKKETLDKQKDVLEDKEKEFLEWCWKNIYKKHEQNFKEAFRGHLTKQAFKDKLLHEYKNNTASLLVIEEIHKKAKTIFGNTPQNLPMIYNIEFQEISEIESNEIWQTKVIGKNDVDIAELIQKLNLNDWVNQGREFIQEDSNICPFCQQETITEEFKKKLEDYFDESFMKSVQLIQELFNKYNQQYENIINQLEQIESNQKDIKESKLNLEKFLPYLQTLKSQYQSNKEMLNSKRKEPSRSIDIVSTKMQLESIKGLIDEANIEIRKHNTIVQNFEKEKLDLISQIWKFIVEENKEEISKFDKNMSGLTKGIEKLTKEYKQKRDERLDLNKEIKELNKNVTSIQPTIDEINRLLRFYGFTNFEIVPSRQDSNKYQILREDGSLAESTLSEGEITFITFLYYYQLTKGSIDKDSISNDRVLVIDDPISSLDSNILFVVSSLIKELIQKVREDITNIKQLIVLTHNVYFHKEISFINSRVYERNDTHFWIIKKQNNVSKIYSYGMKNPIQTSYQLLWRELMESNQSSLATIQNIMRRIIENYFKILGDYKDDTIIDKFETHEERVICKSLMSWVNDGSHSIQDDLYIELPNMQTEQYLSVFKRIFEFTGHISHYNMMMKIEEIN